MTVSVVHASQNATTSGTVNPVTIDVSAWSTPTTGDVVVLAYEAFGSRVPTAVSGLGATWTQAPFTSGVVRYWIGTGATSAGTITVTQNDVGQAHLAAYLVRGLASSSPTGQSSSTSSAAETGPTAVMAGAGEIAFTTMRAQATTGITFPATETPSGWTFQAAVIDVGTARHGYRIPASTQTNHSVTGSGSDGNNKAIGLMVLGTYSAPPTDITGAVAATLPALTSSAAAVATTTGVVAATLPALSAAITNVTPPTAVVGTTLPALSSSVGVLGAPPIAVARCHTPMGAIAILPLVAADPLPTTEPIRRHSVVMANLTAAHPIHARRGCPTGDNTVIKADIGTVQLWIGGVNVTYLRGVPTVIRRWESESPIGDTAAAFEFPQLNPWDAPGSEDLTMLYPDAPVAIGIVNALGDVRRVWSGYLDARGNGLVGENEDYAWEAKGTLTAALHGVHEPRPFTTPTDIWVLIARTLNAVVGRRWALIPETPIGITTLTRGSRDDKPWDYVQALLGEAINDDGRQWTVIEAAPGIIRPALKPAPTEVHATVAYGTPGVDIDLRIDESTRVDGYYVSGIAPNAGGWANIFFPGLELVNPPPYPNDDASNMGLGDTDADTSSGTGISDLQERINELGTFGRHTVTGVFTSAWATILRDVQRRLGIAVDGSPGPQTWNAIHDRAGAGIKIEPLRLPLVVKPNSWPTLHSATGTVLGENPDFDDTRVPRFLPLQLGARKTKTEGARIAQALLDVYGEAGAFGQAVFEYDPNDTDRLTLSHLSNIKVTGHESTDRVLQASHKVVTVDQGDDGPALVVTLDLDEHARDAMWVEDLLVQRRNAQPDLSRRPNSGARSSRIVVDERGPWDSESPCGILRRTAINGAAGLPSIITVPFAEVGKLAGIKLTATQPFAFAILASTRLTENQALSIVGNPFTSDDPWRSKWAQLEPYGIIEAWGQQGQACGYSPQGEDTGGSFTGSFLFNTPLDYWTETPHLASILIFMRGASGFIKGRFIPAYEGS